MRINKTLKIMAIGSVLSAGFFATILKGDVAHAEYDWREEYYNHVTDSEQVPVNNVESNTNYFVNGKYTKQEPGLKDIKVSTLAELKKVAADVYNNPSKDGQEYVHYATEQVAKEFDNYQLYTSDISEDLAGYSPAIRGVGIQSDKLSNGVYAVTILGYNAREAEEQKSWVAKMDKAEKYIVDHYKLETDYDVVVAVNSFIADQITYGVTNTSSHPYLDEYILPQCTGYADLSQELYKRFGIKSRSVRGDASWDGSSHQWNAVHVGGQWYYTDATQYDANKSSKYFLMTNAEGSIPRNTKFKVTDKKFEMSMAKPYSYQKVKKQQAKVIKK
ncbi:transglutaminase domain-containing protein [Lysinibacillus xylanilyticus]|uniref:transglutaminase domain-containing protein n=1 Tax=Lysinibacillus xylanilyticus TaxID=582475 RepID=UPI0037F30268